MKLNLALVALHFVAVAASISLNTDNNESSTQQQCAGYDIDFSRLRSLSTNDINSLIGSNSLLPTHTYGRSQVTVIMEGSSGDDNQATPPRCLGTRHRLYENIEGVPIFGADILVTTDDCLTDDTNDFSIATNYGGNFLSLLLGSGGDASEEGTTSTDTTPIQRLTGKTFDAMMGVSNGYTPGVTAEEAAQTIADHVGADLEDVGEPTLEVFISTGGDFLAYRSYVIVLVDEDENESDESSATADLIEIVVDAHDLAILSQCTLTESSGGATIERRERSLLRSTIEITNASTKDSISFGMDTDQNIHHRELFNCESCATVTPVDWSDATTTCATSSLYLDDVERTTICTVGVSQDDQSAVVGPGPVPDLFWKGTMNCGGTQGTTCTAVVLPECRDALSDVQFGGVASLQFLRDHLGFKGGIHMNANTPVSIKAYAHYLKQYCNAFYNPSLDNVYFGDCNCRPWSPLASVDIVGHEIFHGVTFHSSKLVYKGQSGGLNEGYSDIFGTILEFSIDDYNDTPDFTIAEQVGAVLRNMEFPDQNSIKSVCDYTEGLKVHYASGALNKAFVKSVRLCVADGCSDLAGCTMVLGTSFVYSNIHGLTQTSNFLDGAEASCSLVDEYFAVRTPETTCTATQVKQFIIDGWETVDVAIDGSNCLASTTCPVPPSPAPSPNPTRRPTTSAPTRSPSSTQKPTTPAPTRSSTTGTTDAPDEDDEDESPTTGGGGLFGGLNCFARIRDAFKQVFSWVGGS